MSSHPWLADRTAKFDSSGIRKVFDLAAKMANPINLSIGQPDFPVPDAVKEAAIAAIRADKNGYSVTQGVAEFRERLQAGVDEEHGHAEDEDAEVPAGVLDHPLQVEHGAGAFQGAEGPPGQLRFADADHASALGAEEGLDDDVAAQGGERLQGGVGMLADHRGRHRQAGRGEPGGGEVLVHARLQAAG